MVPTNFKLLYTSSQITERIAQLGEDIGVWAREVWEQSHTDVIAIPILRGGVYFFTDLSRAIPFSVEIASAQAWAYQEAKDGVPRDVVKVNISSVPAEGRRILLVDDICDSGRTLAALKENLLEAGALEVRTAVLIKRMMESETFDPDWVAFEYSGKEWFVGYGMDNVDRWRNLPDVHIITQS